MNTLPNICSVLYNTSSPAISGSLLHASHALSNHFAAFPPTKRYSSSNLRGADHSLSHTRLGFHSMCRMTLIVVMASRICHDQQLVPSPPPFIEVLTERLVCQGIWPFVIPYSIPQTCNQQQPPHQWILTRILVGLFVHTHSSPSLSA